MRAHSMNEAEFWIRKNTIFDFRDYTIPIKYNDEVDAFSHKMAIISLRIGMHKMFIWLNSNVHTFDL